ncbi:MAG TPA: hypothetical protein VIN58_01700 [Roseateles sp.]
MTPRLIAPLLCLSMAGPVLAQAQHVSLSGMPLAGQNQASLPTADPELNWRDPQWLARQRERSRWRYQLGLEQQLRSPVQLGPQAAVREALWAGVSYDLTNRLSGGIEAPILQRDTGWASRMNFERPRSGGLAGLRGALSYKLGPQSKLMLKPQAHRVQLTYAATW